MKKAAKVAYGIAMNGGMVACAVAGLFYGVEWAKNIALFLMWVSTVMLTLAAFNKDAKQQMHDKGRTTPRWFSVGSDLALMVVFASAGHFLYATMSVWQISCEASIFDKKEA
jgi:hypothetical protein